MVIFQCVVLNYQRVDDGYSRWWIDDGKRMSRWWIDDGWCIDTTTINDKIDISIPLIVTVVWWVLIHDGNVKLWVRAAFCLCEAMIQCDKKNTNRLWKVTKSEFLESEPFLRSSQVPFFPKYLGQRHGTRRQPRTGEDGRLVWPARSIKYRFWTDGVDGLRSLSHRGYP